MHAEDVTLRDAIAYQELNMRAARMVLQERTAIVVEHDIAKRVTANKRHDAEQMRIARTHRVDRVDAAIEEVREAHHHEQLLERYLAQVSKSLRESLQRHSVQTHHDLQHLILEHARISGVYERRVLDMLGLFDMDLSAAAQEAQSAAMLKANVKRKMTPAQAAAARVVRGEADKPPADHAPLSLAPTHEQEEEEEEEEEHEPAAAPSVPAMEEPQWLEDEPEAPAPIVAPDPEPSTAEWLPQPQPEQEREPEEEPPSLFRSRMTGGRGFGGLSASEAAKTLAGTF